MLKNLSDLEQTCSKSKENVINRKNEYGIYFTSETGFL
jgi:hypothetical protein